MQKYNIMGWEMIKVDDLKHAIRVLRKRTRENWFNYSDEQKTAALSDMIGESVMDLCTKDHAKEVRELRIQELEVELRRLKGEDEDATV